MSAASFMSYGFEDFDEVNLKSELLEGITAFGSITKPSPVHKHSLVPIIRNRDMILQAPPTEDRLPAVSIGILQRVDASIPGLQALVLAHNDVARGLQASLKSLSRYMHLRIDIFDDESCSEEIERIRSWPAPILIVTVEGALTLIQCGALNNTFLKVYWSYDGNKLFPQLHDDRIPRDPGMMAIRHWLPEDVQRVILFSQFTKSAAALTREIMQDPIIILSPNEEEDEEDEDFVLDCHIRR